MTNPASISHWFGRLNEKQPAEFDPRESLAGTQRADVCIVGAGYTGLWTACELLRADPALRVVVVEARTVGYGASGRNGGAVIAQLNGSREFWTKRAGPQSAIAMERAVQEAVDQVGEAVKRENIDCAYAKNGVLIVARNELERAALLESIDEDRKWGFGAESSEFIDAAKLAERVHIEGASGARFSPNCASVDPGRLVRGLGRAVERLGGRIFENSPVTRIARGRALAEGGLVEAPFVIRATEAYTESLDGLERQIVPVHTSMLATEPIDDRLWEKIGWAGREAVLAEHPFLHLQHTDDNRITIGGDDNRIPYRYNSAPNPDGPASSRVFNFYRSELVRLFPALSDVRIESSWQGIFGAPRDWAPSVGLDRDTGLGWAGGYVGEGLAASNLAGRTLRDLILKQDTELTKLPWVGKESGRWHPEPLRATGAAVVWAMRATGDPLERRTGKPSRLIELGFKLAGFNGHLG